MSRAPIILGEQVPAYSRLEVTVSVDKDTYANPFGPGAVAVEGHFVDPATEQETVLPGFWQ